MSIGVSLLVSALLSCAPRADESEVAVARYAAEQAPRLGPEIAMGEPVVGHTSGGVFGTDVACSRALCMAVWRGLSGSFALRLDKAGSRLDSAPIALPIPHRVAFPSLAIASDGTDFFVVWSKARAQFDDDLYGTRITATGMVLDPNGIPLATDVGMQWVSDVAFGGSRFLIVYATDPSSSDDHAVDAVSVDTAGRVQGRVSLSSSVPYPPYPTAGIATDGTNFVVAWPERLNRTIEVARVSPEPLLLGAPFAVASSSGIYTDPVVAFDGTNYLVAWSQSTEPATGADVYGARVAPDGRVLDSPALPFAVQVNLDLPLGLAFDGGRYLLSWWSLGSASLRAARITTAGQSLDGEGFVLSE